MVRTNKKNKNGKWKIVKTETNNTNDDNSTKQTQNNTWNRKAGKKTKYAEKDDKTTQTKHAT